jgi:hypothetical protein
VAGASITTRPQVGRGTLQPQQGRQDGYALDKGPSHKTAAQCASQKAMHSADCCTLNPKPAAKFSCSWMSPEYAQATRPCATLIPLEPQQTPSARAQTTHVAPTTHCVNTHL